MICTVESSAAVCGSKILYFKYKM